MTTPGRTCPAHYGYPPESLSREPEVRAETVYVIGGLYGNRLALEAILRLGRIEATRPTLVFNGDFNWLNVSPAGFDAVNELALDHVAMRGNVETELSMPSPGTGCGCAYPEEVSDEEVTRSNAILERLRSTAADHDRIVARLAALPANLVACVGGVRVGIVHGDARSLAGWGFSEGALGRHLDPDAIRGDFTRANVRLFASTHSGLPVARRFRLIQGAGAVFNNGAAGLPNFRGTKFGLITRISTRPATDHPAVYGTKIDDVHVDAIRVHYDDAAWRKAFRSDWPCGSAAHASYHDRIRFGPRYEPASAVREGISTW